MFVSGVVAIVALVGILVALFGAGVFLAYVDRQFDANRNH